MDLSLMKNITVTPNGSAIDAEIETGNRLGDVALALNAHGRAIPHGTSKLSHPPIVTDLSQVSLHMWGSVATAVRVSF